MAYLAKARKVDLIEVAEEIGEVVDPTSKVAVVKQIILNSKFYVEEEVRVILDRVMEDRKKQEENEERIRQEEREEKIRQEEREERLLREAKQYELEMKRLEKSSSELNEESPKVVEHCQKIQLAQITPKFDEKRDEMGLYLINFERRAELAKVPKKDWVAYLLGVLPAELSNMLARESPTDAANYDFVKTLILKRYKLNSEKLKQCFYRHQKTSDKSWRNYSQELISYFSEWIAELKVTTFEELKDLIVTEQLKFRVPTEVREHFLEDWLKFKNPIDLAEKLDEYDSIRESFKKKEFPNKSFSRNQIANQYSHKNKESSKDYKLKAQTKTEVDKPDEKEFEKRKQLRCFECGSTNHLRPQCDKLKKIRESVASHIFDDICYDQSMAPYTSIGLVNGIEMKILRDTGATLDLICSKYVKSHMYTKEKVWLKTPFEETSICLPLAEVDLKCDMGNIVTKAAVLSDSLDHGRYLLGNKTAALLEEKKGARQKLQLEKVTLDSKIKKLEDSNRKVSKEREDLDEKLLQKLSVEEEKSKHLQKLKTRHEVTIADIDEKLRREQKMRQELEQTFRKVETELNDVKEQLSGKKLQVEELQSQVNKDKKELSQALKKCDEEIVIKTQAQIMLRELEDQLTKVLEDLEAEKEARAKVEKQKKDQNEELEALRNELLNSKDSTAIQQALRTKMEEELNFLKKNLEVETATHQSHISDLRIKQTVVVEKLKEQLDSVQKAKVALEKIKSNLECENNAMSSKLQTLSSARNKSERERKQMENQLQELVIRYEEVERSKTYAIEKAQKLQAEVEAITSQLNQDIDNKASQTQKVTTYLESQLSESQEQLQEEISEVSERKNLQEKLIEKEADADAILEKQKKKMSKDIDMLQRKLDELQMHHEKLDKSKRKQQSEVEDINIELKDHKETSDKMKKEKKRKSDKKLLKSRLKGEFTVSKFEIKKKKVKKNRDKLYEEKKDFMEKKTKKKKFLIKDNQDTNSEKDASHRSVDEKKRKDKKKFKTQDSSSLDDTGDKIFKEQSKNFSTLSLSSNSLLRQDPKSDDRNISLLCEEKVPASPEGIGNVADDTSSSIIESNRINSAIDILPLRTVSFSNGNIKSTGYYHGCCPHLFKPFINQCDASNPRFLLWALILQPFNYEVVHCRGKHHQNADSLSRLP